MNHSMNPAEQALVTLFSRQFVFQFGIPGSEGGDGRLESPHQTHVAVRGERGEFRVSLYCSGDYDAEETFLQIVQRCHQALPHLHLAEETPPAADLIEFYACSLQSDIWGKCWLSLAGAGSFSNQELQDMRWYILDRQVLQARLILFEKAAGVIDTCLQPGNSGELYRIESERQEGEDRLVFRNQGPYCRDLSDTCYFAGTVEFPVTLLSSFLAGLPMAASLPESLMVLDASGRPMRMSRTSEGPILFLPEGDSTGTVKEISKPTGIVLSA